MSPHDLARPGNVTPTSEHDFAHCSSRATPRWPLTSRATRDSGGLDDTSATDVRERHSATLSANDRVRSRASPRSHERLPTMALPRHRLARPDFEGHRDAFGFPRYPCYFEEGALHSSSLGWMKTDEHRRDRSRHPSVNFSVLVPAGAPIHAQSDRSPVEEMSTC
jgi:hypothetical protein